MSKRTRYRLSTASARRLQKAARSCSLSSSRANNAPPERENADGGAMVCIHSCSASCGIPMEIINSSHPFRGKFPLSLHYMKGSKVRFCPAPLISIFPALPQKIQACGFTLFSFFHTMTLYPRSTGGFPYVPTPAVVCIKRANHILRLARIFFLFLQTLKEEKIGREIIMTNINCTSDCIHQVNGKCNLEQIMVNTVTLQNQCAYFEQKPRPPKNPTL